ncbi:hypothetical protein Cs7R123_09730 [Catellatospora sp. TT07R-123]|uniref:DUF2264 domain-containing protein n=1 Tax=Catellatospora sp. TT07R-123 TaxID=2733863 RepID=UPI001B0FF2EF|nr:DUF2264 domain-containing protein [Catellatospora sp. TT07R-123]GHJ43631.1 hypothetical protein Cs7R123_09730 [Catellatospora sp. TT07R-123]
MSISPYTGWTRTEWAGLADRMLAAAWRHASPTGARITPPGAPGGYGTAVDGLEGFARTFLLAGFRVAGEQGRDPDNLLERYARGIAAGTDPDSSERWVTPREHGQAKVEAASIALILDLTRPWLWDRLDAGVQERVVAYLAQVVGDDTYPRNNWAWFRIVVEQFLASVGGPWSRGDMEADLARHESFARAGGWYSDGDERSYDHYVGWALHLYPIMWARMAGAQELAAPRLPEYRRRLDGFLLDAVRLVGADGCPLVQGRSLVYRFAAAAPFWAGAVAGSDALDPGLLRRAASGIVKHFTDRGAPDADGLLTLGWYHPWRRMAQRYSGTASPYWASKGMLGLALPADHPVWTAVEQPLPVEQEDQLAVVAAPGWALAGTRADGVVRVYNHGTDHARPGDRTTDSPLYARLGYSTATAPALDDDGWDQPFDQSVVLLDATGQATHRSGFTTLDVRLSDGGEAAVLASRARCRWMRPDRAAPDHGSGLPGEAVDAATVTTVSLVRGAWEVRAVHVDPDGAPGWDQVVGLRLGGWPVAVAGPGGTGSRPLYAEAEGTAHTSTAAGLHGLTAAGVHLARDAGPLGEWTAIPWLRAVPAPGSWHLAALALNGGARAPLAQLDGPEDAPVVQVTWPDGARTTAALPLPPTETHHHAQNRSRAA